MSSRYLSHERRPLVENSFKNFALSGAGPSRKLSVVRRRGKTRLTPRIKKLIGAVVIPVWLLVYVGVAVNVADLLAAFWLAKLIYFFAAGIAWALPVLPLMKWMNAGSAAAEGEQ